MPVTVRPQPDTVGHNTDRPVTSSTALLARTSKAWRIEEPPRWTRHNKQVGPETREVLRHSFADLDGPTQPTTSDTSKQPEAPPAAAAATTQGGRATLVPYGNGFVDGILRAFQQDLHLVLRPDDVWLAIVTQFSFYVNGHAEELRGSLVSHEGKEVLVVDMTPHPVRTVDVGLFARKMVDLMSHFLVEPDVADWLVPRFSTTTDDDRSVAAMVMMSTMKAYFEYVMMCGCGFPSVTLEGERADWADMRDRVRRFANYGPEPAEWSTYLDKTLEYMVASFDRPEDDDVKDFWMRAAHWAGSEGSGRGVASLSGWLTAFCFWDEEGQRIHTYTDEYLKDESFGRPVDRKRLVLDGVSFPIIRQKAIPKAVADVPVKVYDMASGEEMDTTLVAGSVGMVATASDGGEKADTFRPRSGWWMFLDESKPLE